MLPGRGGGGPDMNFDPPGARLEHADKAVPSTERVTEGRRDASFWPYGELCPMGTYREGRHGCLNCPLGRYGDSNTLSSDEQCKGCPPGDGWRVYTHVGPAVSRVLCTLTAQRGGGTGGGGGGAPPIRSLTPLLVPTPGKFGTINGGATERAACTNCTLGKYGSYEGLTSCTYVSRQLLVASVG